MIAIKKLRVALGSFLLEDIELEVEQGEYFIILGPTGAGKTVLLEAIAGIHPIVQGEVWIGDREVAKLNPEKRGGGNGRGSGLRGGCFGQEDHDPSRCRGSRREKTGRPGIKLEASQSRRIDLEGSTDPDPDGERFSEAH